MNLPKGKCVLRTINKYIGLLNAKYSALPQDGKTSDSFPVPKAKKKKDPFMKNAFVGIVDEECLQFSTQSTSPWPDSLRQFIHNIRSIDEPVIDHYKTLKKFGEFGFYQLSSLQTSDVMVTNLLHFYEELKLDPSLTLLLELNSTYIIPTLTNHGSNTQKRTYLDQLLKGEILGAFAMSEKTGGSDPMSLKSLAQEGPNGSYVINGEKCWVINAPIADFFIVLAHLPLMNLRMRDGSNPTDLCAFIVDKNSNIHVENHDFLGLSGCKTGKITLSDFPVSSQSLIGTVESGLKIAELALKSPKFISLICYLNQLKRLISDVSLHAHSRKYFPRSLKECEIILNKITNISCCTYTLESMLYFTADLMDRFDTDTSLESALLQIYGFENCLSAVDICMELLGGKVYDKKYPYEKLWRDLKGLSLVTPTLQTRMFASLIGLDYAGNKLKETIIKSRNPLEYPSEAIKKLFFARQFHSDKLKLTQNLYKDFHPSLKEASDQLESSILRLRYVVEVLFSRHGSQVVYRQLDLNRLTNISLDIFSMVSVLRRASHSYCTGVENCDQEILLTRLICFEACKRVKLTTEFIMALDSNFSDNISIDIANFTLHKKSYILSHPLEHKI